MKSEVIARFKELVKAGLIKEGLRRHATGNIELPVINGGIFWDNIASCNGWCIQQHSLLSNCRILGPGDKRYAWGTESYIEQCIMRILMASEDELVFAEFDKLVQSGQLLERLNKQASTNIEWGTLGGEVFWDNLHNFRGWRIQQHKWFQNCRILGPDDTRYAWGCRTYIYRRIMGHPINVLVNYLHDPQDGDQCFAKYPTATPKRKGSVVLVHGLGCRAIAMEPAAQMLAQAGYDAYCFDYQSAFYSIPELGKKFLRNLKYLINQLPPKEKLYILTHSMGGIITRKALELDREPNSLGSRISQIVMLGPPNNGSLMADLAILAGVGVLNKSINDLSYLTESEVKKIGRPTCYHKAFGIIAGTWDLKVLPQDSVAIPGMIEGIDYKITQINATHPQLKKSFDALYQAICFFETGDFHK